MSAAMPQLVLDVLLVAVICLYAVSGWRSGLLRAGLGIAGFFLGAGLAIRFLPDLLTRVDALHANTRLRLVVLLVAILLAGSTIQSVGVRLAARMTRRISSPALHRADAAGGALLVAAACAVVLFLLASTLRLAGSPAVSAAMARSKVIGGIGTVVPDQTQDWLARGRAYLTDNGFPQVFGGGGPEPIPQVGAPDTGLTRTPAVQVAQRSIVKVTADAPACNRAFEGTGWVSSAGRIVTNAHVVAGASRVYVQVGATTRSAQVVWFDPAKDVAVLAVADLGLPALARGAAEVGDGTGVVVAGYPLDGPYVARPGRVRDTVNAVGRDIYGVDRVTREVYSVRAVVQPGNSGGPLLDGAGRVVGLVFASSLEDDETGYALTLDEIDSELTRAPNLSAGVATGRCLSD